MLYQQGDVLIESVPSIPEGAVLQAVRTPPIVLVAGTATGNAHVVHEPIQLYEDYEFRYCHAESEFTIQHEEHASITIPSGEYQIRQVREYDHFTDETHEVYD